MNPPALDETAREAIQWMVLLHSGEVSPQQQQRFTAWLHGNERNQAAWQHLNGPVTDVLSPVRLLNQVVPGQARALADAMSEAKTRVQKRRRLLRGALAIGGASTGAAAVLHRFQPLQATFADLSTGTGQRQRFELSDGSSLLLNARSAADVQMTSTHRRVRLQMGAVIADVPLDPARPFSLTTRYGDVLASRTARTRFLAQQQEQGCLVAALDQPLQIVPRNGRPMELLSGRTLWLAAEGASPSTAQAASAASWENGRVAVYDRPLGEVIEAMRSYRTGLLRISPPAAALKVYGNYPLDDTDEALRSIAETLPVAVHVHSGGWLVRIELA